MHIIYLSRRGRWVKMEIKEEWNIRYGRDRQISIQDKELIEKKEKDVFGAWIGVSLFRSPLLDRFDQVLSSIYEQCVEGVACFFLEAFHD